MNSILKFFQTAMLGGLLVVLPLTIIVIIFLKAVISVREAIAPLVDHLLPWSVHFPVFIAISLILVVCFVVGLIIQTSVGKGINNKIEKHLFERIPGYLFARNFLRRLVGVDEMKMEVALVVLDGAFVPAFIVEKHQEGRYTVFIPTAPTPTAGAIYILPADRVHIVDVPFTKAVKCITHWGEGAKDLLAAIKK